MTDSVAKSPKLANLRRRQSASLVSRRLRILYDLLLCESHRRVRKKKEKKTKLGTEKGGFRRSRLTGKYKSSHGIRGRG